VVGLPYRCSTDDRPILARVCGARQLRRLALQAKLNQAAALLRAMEWDVMNHCPVCSGYNPEHSWTKNHREAMTRRGAMGHRDDCALAAFLAECAKTGLAQEE
jgi:hypothetical protein